jgi:UDP-glucose:(heptosyl)LPS alpha-1,3-glucosyltransferase
MNIALVLQRFDPRRGGLEHWAWQFATHLIDLGHQVHVVASEFTDEASGMKLVLHRIAPSSSPLGRAAAMERMLRSLDVDVIHDMGCGWYADIFHPQGGSSLALWEQNLLRIPRWRQIRFWREKRYREQAEIEKRQHTRRGAMIVPVSEMDRVNFLRLHNLREEQLHRIYNGVDTERFSPERCTELREPMRLQLKCQDNETLFLLVALNLRLKNAETAIRAFARLIAGGAKSRLLIVGGKRPAPFIKLASKLGISDFVVFINHTDDIGSYYGAADVYLQPTWYDPCSLAMLEALSCGLPVITTRFNGAAELIQEGISGFICHNPADACALALKMNELQDALLRGSMATAARSVALENSFERNMREFLELYSRIISIKQRDRKGAITLKA